MPKRKRLYTFDKRGPATKKIKLQELEEEENGPKRGGRAKAGSAAAQRGAAGPKHGKQPSKYAKKTAAYGKGKRNGKEESLSHEEESSEPGAGWKGGSWESHCTEVSPGHSDYILQVAMSVARDQCVISVGPWATEFVAVLEPDPDFKSDLRLTITLPRRNYPTLAVGVMWAMEAAARPFELRYRIKLPYRPRTPLFDAFISENYHMWNIPL